MSKYGIIESWPVYQKPLPVDQNRQVAEVAGILNASIQGIKFAGLHCRQIENEKAAALKAKKRAFLMHACHFSKKQ